jgi:hypothetical protein
MTAHRISQSYVSRWLFGTSQKTPEEAQREASEALRETVASLVRSVDALRASVEDQLGLLGVLRSSLQVRTTEFQF